MDLIKKGRTLLEESGVRVVKESSIYCTQPCGFRWQPSFLNQVIEGKTALSPHEVLELIHRIECKLGRLRLFRGSPRTIDIDLLFYNNLVMETPELTIPHRRLDEREFVLVPLREIAPNLRHPVLGLTVSRMLEDVKRGGVRLWR